MHSNIVENSTSVHWTKCNRQDKFCRRIACLPTYGTRRFATWVTREVIFCLDCSQSSIFSRKIIKIERFALRISSSCMTPWNVLRHQCHVGPLGTEVSVVCLVSVVTVQTVVSVVSICSSCHLAWVSKLLRGRGGDLEGSVSDDLRNGTSGTFLEQAGEHLIVDFPKSYNPWRRHPRYI